MREIKFRLWDKEKKVIIPNNGDDYEEEYCYLVMFIGGSLALCWSQDDDVFFKDVSDKYEIMQFTGLKDSNGKEIYDGDIVSWLPDYVLKNSKALIGKVVWGCEGFYLEQITDEKWQIDDYPSYPAEFYCVYDESIERLFMWEELEVIGNIYENPELLKEVKNEYTVCMESF